MTRYLLQWLANPRSGVFPCSALILLVIALGQPVAAIEVQVPSTVSGGSLNVPFGGGTFSQERVQSIYLASEIGTTGKIRSLTVTFSSIPNFTLNNCTIRMKHTTLASFASASWDGGFTTVFNGTVTVSSTGAYTFVFTTPFNYTGGSNNLIVDVSWQNGSANSMAGSINYTNTTSGGNRSLWYRDSGAAGAPTSWTGVTPAPNTAVWVPNYYLGISSRLHVKTVASGRGNGIDWDNALGNLTSALTNSSSGDEIWVAAGTYKPGVTRTNTFQLKSGVTVYGGFNGTETSAAQRVMSNQTILSGDIGTLGTFTDNCYHVVTGATGGVIDGFVIRDGFANTTDFGVNSGGGGVLCYGTSPTIRNCVFTSNNAYYAGGAIYIANTATATIENCVFTGNGGVGGITCQYGGAIEDEGGQSPIIRNCTFYNNVGTYGGAIEIVTALGTTSVINCVLWGNDSAGPEFYNGGKAISFSGNTIKNGTAQFSQPSGTPTNGGSNDALDPLFFNIADVDGPDNLFGTSDDGLTLMPPSPAIDGAVSGGPSTDLVKRSRSAGGAPDRGAYEIPVIYVSALATGADNGTSWYDAYTQLSDAMSAAAAGPVEVWVRSAIYKPTTGSDRSRSFALRHGMGLYGGFGGIESLRSQRDWRMRATTLSGDIGTVGAAGDNSYHVLTTASGPSVLDGFLVREGIANQGFPNDRGGGLYQTAAATIRRCVFVANSATYGAGIFSNGGLVTMESAQFLANSATGIGGGIYLAGAANSTLRNCLFWRNANSGGGYGGGGMFIESSTGVVLTNATFAENTAVVGGGGLQVYSTATTLRNAIFWGNTTSGSANQIANLNGGSSSLEECLIQGGLPSGSTNAGGLQSADPQFLDTTLPLGADNIPGTGDDGLTLRLSSPALNEGTATGASTSDLAGNLRQIGSAVDLGAYERLNVLYVDVDAGGANNGSSWANAYRSLVSALTIATSGRDEIWIAEGTYYPSDVGDPTKSFTLVPQVGVYGGFAGGETFLSQRSLATRRVILSGDVNFDSSLAGNSAHVLIGANAAIIDGLTVADGYADGSQPVTESESAAGLLDYGTSTTAVNCIFSGNVCTYLGGGIMSYGNSMTQMRGCLFTGNQARFGGAFFVYYASVGIANVTCSGNSASNYGGSTYIYSGQATIGNSILWGDSLPALFNDGSSVWIAGSNVQKSGGSGGSWDSTMGVDQGNNLDVEPNFVKDSDPAGADGVLGTDDDGLRLYASSPCIDAGIRAGGPNLDLLGASRPAGSASDQGCYEGKMVTVDFLASTSSGLESVTAPTITVRLSEASDLPVTVTYARATGSSGGNATLTSDFTLGALSLTFSPGETTKSLNLTIVDDTVEEISETIGFVLTGATNARIDGTTLHTYSILNNDTAGIITSPTVISINESGAPTSATITLSLNSTPANAASVSVVVSSSAPTEARLSFGAAVNQSQVTVTWTSGDYGAKVVTVASVDDLIKDDNFTLLVTTAPATSADGFYSGKDADDVQVTVVDNDLLGLVLSKTTVAVTEVNVATTDSFTVKLRSEPTGTVTVQASSSNTADATVSGGVSGNLTFGTNRFGANGWDVAQTITVTAVNDQVDEPGTNSVAFSILLDANSGADLKYDNVSASVTGTLTDNDSAGFTVTPVLKQTPNENGGTTNYSVVLDSKPTAAVTIGVLGNLIRSSDTAEGTVSSTTLLFGTNSGSGGWDFPQTVTVTAVNDAIDATNPDYQLIFPAASSGDAKYNGNFAKNRDLQNTDDDMAGITFSPISGLVTTELGGTATFTARLDSKPTGNNTVQFTITALQSFATNPAYQGQLSVDVAYGGNTYAANGGTCTLTFTATDGQIASASGTSVTAGWNTPVTVTIKGIDDPGNTASQLYYISRSAATSLDTGYSGSGGFFNATAVLVTNQSKDAAGVTVNPTALTVTEAAGTNHSATFTVKLVKQPTDAVNIALSFATNAGQATLSTTSLSFSTTSGVGGGWDMPQTVTVTAVDDGIDDGDLITNIGFVVSSSTDMTYNGLAVPALPVTCTDDDTRGIVVAPASGLSTTEAGGQAIFVVYLSSQPTASGTVTIGLSSLDPSEGLIRQGVSGTATTTLSLAFTDANWNIPKVVSIVGQDDAIDDGDISYLIDFDTYSATAGDYNTALALPTSVAVVNQDDDTARVLLSKTSMALEEDPTPVGPLVHADTYTIALGSQPTDDVVVTLDPGSKATVSASTITFTSGDWNTPVIVTVTAVDDVVAEGIHQALVTHTVSSVNDTAYHGLIAETVIATITDDDTAHVTAAATPATLTTEESGTPDEIAYTLDTQPRGNVTVLLTSTDPDEAIPVPDRLTFTPTDYNNASAHIVQVRGVDDDVADGNQPFSIIATAISADTVYNGITIDDVNGTNQDDDVVGVVFTATSAMAPLTTSETGSAVTFTVRLASQPLANVTVPLSSSDTAEGTVAASQPLTLTFTSSNWDVDQIVTVTGQRDYVDEPTTNTAYSVTIGPSAGTGSGYQGAALYNGLVAANGVVYLENTDIDQAGVLITPSTGLVTSESGSTASYSIVLTSKPSDTVRVNIDPGSPAQLAAVASVDFTPADWSTPQVITVSAVNDDIAEGTVGTPHTGTLDHSLTFPNTIDTTYQALGALTSVTALITDDDTPGIVLNQIDPAVTDEDPLEPQAISTFSLNLLSEPTSMVRITVTSSDPTEILLSTDGIRANATTSVTLDILAANWDSITPPVITAFGINDDIDDGNQVVNVTVAVVAADTADARYDAVSDVVYQITNHDKDTAGVTIVEPTHGLNFPAVPADLSENVLATTYAYTLVLDSEPTGNVTINLSETGQVLIDTDSVTAGNQTSVVFTPTKDQAASGNTAGWNVPLTVTITAVDDLGAETSPHSTSVVHVASGGGYTGVTVASVALSIADNDASTPPVVTLPGTNPFVYDETGHLARIFDSGATVGDVDSPSFQTGNVTVSITTGNVPAEDELGVANEGTAAGQIGVVNSVITYNPIADTGAVQIGTVTSPGTGGSPLVIALAAADPTNVSIEAVQALLRRLTYRNASLNPTLAARTLSLTVNDGDGGTSAAVTKNITITPFDDPPSFAAQNIITVVDQSIAGTLTGSDPEGLALTFTKLTDPLNGTVTVAANGGYTYVPLGGDFANTYTFTVQAADPALNLTTATITIHITGGNETRPQLLSSAPLETELGARFAVLTFNPASTSGSPLTFRVVDQSTADITFTVTPLSNTPTSVTAQVNWQIISAMPTTGDHFTLGIIVTDPGNNAASYIPVTIQLVQPIGPG
jgi:Bacterial Ig domain/Right handed beta helix region/Calx-beta domain